MRCRNCCSGDDTLLRWGLISLSVLLLCEYDAICIRDRSRTDDAYNHVLSTAGYDGSASTLDPGACLRCERSRFALLTRL